MTQVTPHSAAIPTTPTGTFELGVPPDVLSKASVPHISGTELEAQSLGISSPTGTAVGEGTSDVSALANLVGPQGMSILAGVGDPAMILAAIASQLKDLQGKQLEQSATSQANRSEHAQQVRQEALAAAEKASKKAKGFLGIHGKLGKKLSKIVKAITIVATVAVAALGGPLTLGLTIAGMAMLLGADKIADFAVKTGIIGEEDRAKCALYLKLAGAALTVAGGCCNGQGAGMLANAAPKLAELAPAMAIVSRVIQGAGQVIQGTDQVKDAAHTRQAKEHTLDGEEAGNERDAATLEMESSVEELQARMEMVARTNSKIQQLQEAQFAASMAAIRQPV